MTTYSDGATSTLAGIARRSGNRSRSHLYISHVVGKYLPAPARTVIEHAHALADHVAPFVSAPYVFGYAEAAVALSIEVAYRLNAPMTATTRYFEPGTAWCEFIEPHSHAAHHAIRTRPDLRGIRDIVLVDDELTTGTTVMNTIAALLPLIEQRSFVVATLIDARSEADQIRLDQFAHDHDIAVAVVSLEAHPDLPQPAVDDARPAPDLPLAGSSTPDYWPCSIAMPHPRDGLTIEQIRALSGLVQDHAPQISGRVLVLGTEECFWPAQMVASVLGADTLSTTRSPAVVHQLPDYPLRSGFGFDTPAGRRYVYNADGYDAVLIVTDDLDAVPPRVPAAFSAILHLKGNLA